MRRSRLPVLLLVGLVVAVGAACGSDTPLPPAAEPARAPAPTRAPAGRVVAVGHKPEGVAVDPRTGLVAVGLSEPARLALVDAATGRVRRRIVLPGSPRHLALAAPGGPVLVPAEGADALVEVALPSGRSRRVGVGRQPHDAIAARGRVWVADELGDSVSVVRDLRREAVLPGPGQPGGVAATTLGQVAVVAVRERVVELFDARSGRSLAKQPAGVGPTHIATDGGDRLYVTDTDGDALLCFATRDGLQLRRRLALVGEPYGIALDPVRHRLWVTLTARNEVVELPAHGRPHPLRRFPTVRQPNSVGVDPRTGRVFVASRSDGTLQLLDPGPPAVRRAGGR